MKFVVVHHCSGSYGCPFHHHRATINFTMALENGKPPLFQWKANAPQTRNIGGITYILDRFEHVSQKYWQDLQLLDGGTANTTELRFDQVKRDHASVVMLEGYGTKQSKHRFEHPENIKVSYCSMPEPEDETATDERTNKWKMKRPKMKMKRHQ